MIKFFLFICTVGVICCGGDDLIGDLLHDENSFYLVCFDISGYGKDKKRCDKLNTAFNELIELLKKRQLDKNTIRALGKEEFQKLDHKERIQY